MTGVSFLKWDCSPTGVKSSPLTKKINELGLLLEWKQSQRPYNVAPSSVRNNVLGKVPVNRLLPNASDHGALTSRILQCPPSRSLL